MFGIRLARRARRFDTAAAGEIVACERSRIGGNFGGGALRNNGAAMYARTGTDIDDVIGAMNGVFVMLDDDHRIANVAQAF